MLGGADGDGEIRARLAARAAENGLLATAAALLDPPGAGTPPAAEPRRGDPRAGRGQGRGGRRCRRARPARRPGGRQGFVAAGPGRPARSAAGRGRLSGRRRPRRGRGAGRRPGCTPPRGCAGRHCGSSGTGRSSPARRRRCCRPTSADAARSPWPWKPRPGWPWPSTSSASPTPPPTLAQAPGEPDRRRPAGRAAAARRADRAERRSRRPTCRPRSALYAGDVRRALDQLPTAAADERDGLAQKRSRALKPSRMM